MVEEHRKWENVLLRLLFGGNITTARGNNPEYSNTSAESFGSEAEGASLLGGRFALRLRRGLPTDAPHYLRLRRTAGRQIRRSHSEALDI